MILRVHLIKCPQRHKAVGALSFFKTAEATYMRSRNGIDARRELGKPFDPEDVCLRLVATTNDRTKGMVAPYINARTVLDRLDRVLRAGGYHDEYHVLGTLKGQVAVKCEKGRILNPSTVRTEMLRNAGAGGQEFIAAASGSHWEDSAGGDGSTGSEGLTDR